MKINSPINQPRYRVFIQHPNGKRRFYFKQLNSLPLTDAIGFAQKYNYSLDQDRLKEFGIMSWRASWENEINPR